MLLLMVVPVMEADLHRSTLAFRAYAMTYIS